MDEKKPKDSITNPDLNADSVTAKMVAAQLICDVGKQVLTDLDAAVAKKKKKDREDLLLLKKEKGNWPRINEKYR